MGRPGRGDRRSAGERWTDGCPAEVRQELLEGAVTLYGGLLGAQDRAEAIVDRMRHGLAEMRALPTPGAARPKILYFQAMRQVLKVAGANTYNGFTTDLVGGVNPAAELPGWAGVDVEQVLRWDPDIILVGNFDAATPADVYDNPAWKTLSAVRSRRVYKVPLGGYRWDPPSQESPLMWRWLRTLAHPDQDGFDLRAAIRRDLRLLYDYEPSDSQMDRILHLDLNADASAYERFAH